MAEARTFEDGPLSLSFINPILGIGKISDLAEKTTLFFSFFFSSFWFISSSIFSSMLASDNSGKEDFGLSIEKTGFRSRFKAGSVAISFSQFSIESESDLSFGIAAGYLTHFREDGTISNGGQEELDNISFILIINLIIMIQFLIIVMILA